MTVKPSAVETASNSKKSIIIIGSGMGGLAAGIYGQLSGFRTIICEAHHLPGGQCTSWQREGYVFDACLHNLNGFKPNTKINAFWKELGALPCDTIERKEFISAVSPEGTYFHNYFDVDKLESHLKELSPEDTAVIDEYIQGIRAFSKEIDWFGISNLGSFWEKLSTLPFFLGKLKYFKHSLGSFALKFKHPLLRKAFPLFHSSIPDVPLFGYLAEHGSSVIGDITWPEGGGFTLSKNMARRYQELGGTIQYRKRTV